MASYLIYIPGGRGANGQRLLEQAGLAGLDDGANLSWIDVMGNGPDGRDGVLGGWITGDPVKDRKLAVAADQQEWIQGPPNEQGQRLYWIGFAKDHRPEPADIQRQGVHFTSADVLLRDGFRWAIPVVDKLPHRMGLSLETGKFEHAVEARYRKLWDRAGQYALAFFEQIDMVEKLKLIRPDLAPDDVVCEFTLEEAWQYCCELLAMSYRLNPGIITMLDLVHDTEAISIVAASIELSELLALQEKKTMVLIIGTKGISSSSVGSAA